MHYLAISVSLTLCLYNCFITIYLFIVMCLFIVYRSICVSDNLSVGLSMYFVSYAMHVRVFP